MKKRVRPLLVLLLLAILLTACSNSNGETKTPEPIVATPTLKATATPAQPTATSLPEINVDSVKLKGLQIQFMHPWSGDLGIEMAKRVDEFNQTNAWGVHVIAQTPGSSGMLATQLAEDIATGNQPALVAAPLDLLLRLNSSEPVIEDLNPYVYSAQWGIPNADLADFDPLYLEQDQVKGFRYGIPAQRSAAMIFYNSTWAQELGFANPPATPQEFQSQSCAANQALKKDTDNSNDGLGGWIVNTEGWVTYSWLTNFNAVVYTDGVYTFNSLGAQQALEMLQGMFTSGCAWIPRVQTPYDYFAARLALFYSGYLQDILPQLEANSRHGSSDTWTLIPFPSDQTQRVVAEGASYAILSSTPETQLAAWLFIRWMSAPAQQIRLVQTSMTLPLSEQVKNQLLNSSSMSQPWKDAVTAASAIVTVPSDPHWSLAQRVLEDAGWQLFKTNLTSADIPSLLTQMDTTFTELKDHNP